MPIGASAYRQGEGKNALNCVSAAGLFATLLFLSAAPIVAPFLGRILPILQPHFHWMLWSVILFLLLSEWHAGHPFAPSGWRRTLDAAGPTFAALATFTLSGLLGLLLWNRPFLPPAKAGLSLLPVFIGLFSLPSILLALRASSPLIEQKAATPLPLKPWLQGTLSGTAGGFLALLLPALSGGVGSWMAQQTVAASNRRSFLAAQGAARSVYYGGALMLFGLPESGILRGGTAWNLLPYVPRALPGLPLLVSCAWMIGTGIAFLLLGPVGTFLMCRIRTLQIRRSLLWLSLAGLITLTAGTTGWRGLTLMLLSTVLGFLPILFPCRRVHLLGVVLLPVALSLSGYTPQ